MCCFYCQTKDNGSREGCHYNYLLMLINAEFKFMNN